MGSAIETLPDKTDPMIVLSNALERGIAPEQLRIIFDLQERHKNNLASEAFAEAMNACQSEMPVIAKDSRNDSTNSRYAKLETILTKIHPIYCKHGFSLSFDIEDTDKENLVKLRLDVRHKRGHLESYRGEFSIDTEGLKGNANKTQIHGIGSSISYGKRYLIMMVFNITIANQDVDGQKNSSEKSEVKTGKQILAERKAAEKDAAEKSNRSSSPRVVELCRIVAEAKKVGLDDHQWQIVLDKHDAKTEADLNDEQIEKLITSLAGRLSASQDVSRANDNKATKQPATPPQSSPTPAAPTLPPERPATPNKPGRPDDSMARRDDPRVNELVRIVGVLKSHGLTDDMWTGILHRHNAAGVVDLSPDQVETLITKLAAKIPTTTTPAQKGGGGPNGAAAAESSSGNKSRQPAAAAQ